MRALALVAVRDKNIGCDPMPSQGPHWIFWVIMHASLNVRIRALRLAELTRNTCSTHVSLCISMRTNNFEKLCAQDRYRIKCFTIYIMITKHELI